MVATTTQALRDGQTESLEESQVTYGAQPENRRESIHLCHITDPSLRSRVLAMLEKHSAMWHCTPADIKAICHRQPL